MDSVIPAKAGIFSGDPSFRWGDGIWAGVTGFGLRSRDLGWGHGIWARVTGFGLGSRDLGWGDGIKPGRLKRRNFSALNRFLYQKTFLA